MIPRAISVVAALAVFGMASFVLLSSQDATDALSLEPTTAVAGYTSSGTSAMQKPSYVASSWEKQSGSEDRLMNALVRDHGTITAAEFISKAR